MRIVAGKFGSRKIQAVPGTATRPTTDKVREAIFSRIGPYFEGGCMLDLFAGSGAMSLEALSRGFKQSILVEIDPRACHTIEQNVQTLGVQTQITVIRQRAEKALKRLAGKQFDLVFMDPPYAQQQIADLLSQLMEQNLVKPQGAVIAECHARDLLPERIGRLWCVKTVTYGITRITYYKMEEENKDDKGNVSGIL